MGLAVQSAPVYPIARILALSASKSRQRIRGQRGRSSGVSNQRAGGLPSEQGRFIDLDRMPRDAHARLHFLVKDGTAALTTQVQLVYGAFTALALLDPTRLLFGVMLLGTSMVTFFDRCIIAKVLMMMPWNHGSEAGSMAP